MSDEILDLNIKIKNLEDEIIFLKKENHRLKEKILSGNKINEIHVNTLIKQIENCKYTEK